MPLPEGQRPPQYDMLID
jgi:hypothetical protein